MSLTASEKARIGMWLRLVRCYNLAMRELRSGLREDCTMPQFDVLAQLRRAPDGLTFSALSERLLVTAGNLTGIVDRLEKNGFARREVNPRDRRQTFIKLTEAGVKHCDELIPRHERHIVELLDGLGDNEVQNLRNDLHALAQLLDKTGKDES